MSNKKLFSDRFLQTIKMFSAKRPIDINKPLMRLTAGTITYKVYLFIQSRNKVFQLPCHIIVVTRQTLFDPGQSQYYV